MSKFIFALTLMLGIYALLRVGIAFASRTPAIGGIGSNEGNEQLGDCPNKPNCQGSQSSRIKQTVEPLAITLQSSDALPTIASAINELGGKISQQKHNYLHATFKTLLMGYTDDVEFLIQANEVQIRSASRIGQSDLGANKKRINRLRKHLEGKL